jgi:DNA-binding response OmpR family regulator
MNSQTPTPTLRRALLVVEDDADTASLLETYFAGLDYEVAVAARGSDGVRRARQRVPDVVLLDIGLPDMDGYAVCEQLRAAPRTSHIPVIFLSEKAGTEDRVAGLSRGAQDYITKPFDLEELRLRIQNLVARSKRDHLVDPRSGLPTGAWLESQCGQVRGRPGWHRLEGRLDGLQTFIDLNGWSAGDDVLQFSGNLVREVLAEQGTPDDFAGHPANDTLVVLTQAADPAMLGDRLKARFDTEVRAHYSFMDIEQGFVLIRGAGGELAPAPLMTLKVTCAPA